MLKRSFYRSWNVPGYRKLVLEQVNSKFELLKPACGVQVSRMKDFFREKVGNVRFIQLFENEEGKPRGCGLVEFDDVASAKKALELDRFPLRGREIVIKEDLDIERDKYGRLITPGRHGTSKGGGGSGSRGDRERNEPDYPRNRYHDDRQADYGGGGSFGGEHNTYGLSPQFLASLGIKGPLNNRVFVANLDYKVNEQKLNEIFRLAGKVTGSKLYYDSNKQSKGYGVVSFSHPVEAVQAISMFNNQRLHDRLLSVRLDKFDDDEDSTGDYTPSKLPPGLESIGKGLGIGGQPLNISKSMLAGQQGPGPVPPSPSVAPGVSNPAAPPIAAATAAITALTNLAGNLQNLPNLAQSLAQLSASTIPSVPAHNSSIYPTTDPSIAPAAAPSYGGYQSGPLPPAAPQPTYGSTAMPPPVYGPPPSSGPVPPSPYSGNSAPPASINSYSAYERRDYREDNKSSFRAPDTIYVRNLPLNFETADLRRFFSDVGNVSYVEVRDHGTGIVRFGTSRDAQRACDLMNGIRIENRPIDVDLYY